MGLTPKELELGSWLGKEIFLLSTASRPALVPTQPPIQHVLGPPAPKVKRPVAKLTTHFHLVLGLNEWSYTFTSPYDFKAFCLIKQRDNFFPMTLQPSGPWLLFQFLNSTHRWQNSLYGGSGCPKATEQHKH
jgi:hypothetical protein